MIMKNTSMAELQDAINRAFAADCELADDGGLIEGEAARILGPYVTSPKAKLPNDPNPKELVKLNRRHPKRRSAK